MDERLRQTLLKACGEEHMPAIEDLFTKMALADNMTVSMFGTIFVEAAEKDRLKKVLRLCEDEWQGNWQHLQPQERELLFCDGGKLKCVYSRIGLH